MLVRVPLFKIKGSSTKLFSAICTPLKPNPSYVLVPIRVFGLQRTYVHSSHTTRQLTHDHLTGPTLSVCGATCVNLEPRLWPGTFGMVLANGGRCVCQICQTPGIDPGKGLLSADKEAAKRCNGAAIPVFYMEYVVTAG